MKSSTFNFTDQDGIEIFVYKWEPETEIFNEINREEVFKDVIGWLDSYL